MPCPECDLLHADIDRLERVHAEALGLLRGADGKVIASAHGQLRSAAIDAGTEVEIAREKLDRHQREHR